MSVAETIPGIPDQLTGPAAALVLALVALYVLARVIRALWDQHLTADQDDRNQRDTAQALLDLSLRNNAAQIVAWNRRTEQEAARHRRVDKL